MTERATMKIKVIMTDKAMDRPTMDDRERMLSAAVSDGVEISVDCIKRGPDELDCNTDEAFAAPELVKEAIRAEQDGFDAIVIYCFSDVGLDAVRENVRIPVIGPGETSLAAANMLCNRFAVITTESVNIPRTYRRLMRNGIAREKMTSVRALDVSIWGNSRVDDGTVSEKGLRGGCPAGTGGRCHPGLPGHGRLRRDAGTGTAREGPGPRVHRGGLRGAVCPAASGPYPGGVSAVPKRQPRGTLRSPWPAERRKRRSIAVSKQIPHRSVSLLCGTFPMAANAETVAPPGGGSL